MTNREYLYLITKCALGYDDISKHNISLTDETLAYLYNAARIHSLFPIVSKVLIENKLITVDSPYYQPFRKQMLKYVCRREHFDYVLDAICQAFNDAHIPFMPLKGSVLKGHYPESWMRTGADIDILVKKCDLDKASNILSENLKLQFVSKSSHDVVYTTDSKVRIELHYELNEPGYKRFEPLNDIWTVATCVDSSYRYNMPNEYFLTYHVAHMAKHFVCGGCGLRFLLDLRIILDKFECNADIVNNLIKQCGITDFYNGVVSFCDVIFLDAESSEITKALEYFIISGGTFGNLQNKVAYGQAKQGSGFKYAMSRIFLPYPQMVNFYPILKTKKWLTPFYEIKRWFRLIFKGGMERSAEELKSTVNVDEEKLKVAKYLADNLDL